MKACPSCSGPIIDEAIKCKHCGIWLKSYDDMLSDNPEDSKKKREGHPEGPIICPGCHIDIHEDIDMDRARRDLRIDEYTCPKCKGDIVISRDGKIHLVKRNKVYDSIYFVSFGLFVIGGIIAFAMGDDKLKASKYKDIIMLLILSPIIFGFGAQILQGFCCGVIDIRYEFYRAKNPVIFQICLWCTVLVWLFFVYMLFLKE